MAGDRRRAPPPHPEEQREALRLEGCSRAPRRVGARWSVLRQAQDEGAGRGQAVSAANPSATTRRLAAHLNRRARWRWPEIVFWLAILAVIIAAPSRAAIINEVLIAGLFALSLDLILGLAGIVSLGHAAFFGLGAYAAAILSSRGITDPIVGLVLASALAAA